MPSLAERWYKHGVKEGLLKGRQEGIREGKQEGIKKGIRKGLYEAIELGLELKCGIKEKQVIREITRIKDFQKLREIKDLILKAESIEAEKTLKQQ